MARPRAKTGIAVRCLFVIESRVTAFILSSITANVLRMCMQVSEELIRVAILWHELWHEGLEEASRLYFGDRNVKGMFETLEPLHQMLERGPQTLKEISFQHVSYPTM